jgi:hypothetical protein
LTLIAILALALLLAVVWRLARLAIKLLLLGALIALIAGHPGGATADHAAGAPPRSALPGQRHRPPVPPVRRDLKDSPAPGKSATGTRK